MTERICDSKEETSSTLGETFRWCLKEHKSRFECEEIVSMVLQSSKSKIYSEDERVLTPREKRVIETMIAERASGTPLAYVLGCQEFYFESFFVDSRVLIPRPESEILVETAENFLRSLNKENLQILDLGAGSGCLGLSLGKKFGKAKVHLVEKCKNASAVCLQNTFQMGMEEQTHIFTESAETFLEKTSESYDVILANPPYIAWEDRRVERSVLNYEPHLALFADEGGLDFIFSWSRLAQPKLKKQAMMIFEMGSEQAERAHRHFQNLDFDETKIIFDLTERPRFVVGFLHG